MVTAEITGKFDLGYIVTLQDGTEGQLRVVEMKGQCLQKHLEAREEELFGNYIDLDIIFESDRAVIVSQFNNREREKRAEQAHLRRLAKKSCPCGQTYKVKIIQDNDWGFFFRQQGGHLEAAILKDNIPPALRIEVGYSVTVVVSDIDKDGSPRFSVVNVLGNV